MPRANIEAAAIALAQACVDHLGQCPDCHKLYDMAVDAMDKQLLALLMPKVNGNQSRATRVLGLNRATVRKKLRDAGLLEKPL